MGDRLTTERPDQTLEEGLEEAHTGEGPPSTPGRQRRDRGGWRRPIVITLAVVLGVIVYAFAFDKTDVDLGEIQSETRQNQLFAILRALARPELTEYDTEESITDVEVAIPCGPTVSGTAGQISVTPSCASPGEPMTVTGSGFDPGETVTVQFVPESEFDITLPLTRVTADGQGEIETTFEAPSRTSEDPQAVRVLTEERIGSWGDRVETFVDENGNGIRDEPLIPDSGRVEVTLDDSLPETPAVALVDPSRNVEQFISYGEAFTAVDGLANGETAVPVAEAEPQEIQVTTLEPADDGGTRLVVEGPPGVDLGGWRVAVYDATSGALEWAQSVVDSVRMSPRISEQAVITWDRIIETVALALVATTAGLIVAVPLSFFAARNIMRDISVTVTNLALTLIAIPVGAAAGLAAADLAKTATDPFRGSVGLVLGGLVVVPAAIWGILRWAIPPEDTEPPTTTERAVRRTATILAGAIGILGAFLLSELLLRLGTELRPALGPFGFLAGFLRTLGELLDILTPVLAALGGAGVAVNLATKLGYGLRSRLARPALVPLNLVLSALAGASVLVGLGSVIEWLYQLQNPTVTFWIPAAVGAAAGLLIAALGMRSGQVSIGLSVYYISRTVFNTLRSIEPLVMVIVFVVWVGIGPFAGSLALALHTAAALAKLYSEQVESISHGPIEAVRATGATRLQTIVYGVVPQIIPPYISFTMYRWDINVRMSTILGFAGGGGIGFILQQNVNLFNYRAAAVQMLAIAIVVASMDWLSSRLRERFV